jgi:hypothetical protein
VLSEEQHQVQVPHPSFAAQVVLGATLRERDKAEPVSPHRPLRIPREELIDFGRRQSAEASQVSVIDWLVRTCRVAAHPG